MTSFTKDEISRSVKVEIYQATRLWFDDALMKCGITLICSAAFAQSKENLPFITEISFFDL